MIVDDELLGEPLGVVGDAAVIPDDELDLLAGHGVAMLRHVELDCGDDFLPGGADRAGHRHDEADLDGVLGGGAAGAQAGADSSNRQTAGNNKMRVTHGDPPIAHSGLLIEAIERCGATYCKLGEWLLAPAGRRREFAGAPTRSPTVSRNLFAMATRILFALRTFCPSSP